MRVDSEIDLHGYTALEARSELDRIWGRRCWQGLKRVRVIHGNGSVLRKVVRNWCDDRGIPWATELMNPGTTILHPANRTVFPPSVTHRPLSHRMRGIKIALDREQRSRAETFHPTAERREEPLKGSGEVSEKRRTQNIEQPSSDLMAQEFERLSRLDATSLRRRKHA
jgi:hypothetical protein